MQDLCDCQMKITLCVRLVFMYSSADYVGPCDQGPVVWKRFMYTPGCYVPFRL